MRIVFVGTSKISVATGISLLKEDHEVIFIETQKSRIEELSDEMDCGFLEGDGSSPAVLKEVGPDQTDILFCLTENDKDNLIAALVGRSLGFSRVILKVEDPDLEHIATELGLDDVIVPTRTISRHLRDMTQKESANELSNVLKNDARFFLFIAGEDEEGKIGDLELPENSQIVCYYRDDEFHLVSKDSDIEQGDEVVILAHKDVLEKLAEKWNSPDHSSEQE